MPDTEDTEWRFVKFGLIVTGKGEERHIPKLFRSLARSGHCHFSVIHRMGQRHPITSEKKKLKMVGSGKPIPERDVNQIGLPARRYLEQKDTFVILIDDLEADRAKQAAAAYRRYRTVLDTILRESQRRRASVHFFVNMVEAYYFADAQAVNVVLGTDLADFDGDVELIRHPKNELKKLFAGFDEVEHGGEILAKLDVPHVLSRPETCATLRTLFGWCSKAIGEVPSDRFRLRDGVYSDLTKQQLDSL